MEREEQRKQEQAKLEQKQKCWEILRNAIIHEDNLVNYRLTWLLTTEGFLLAGFFAAQSAVLSGNLSRKPLLVVELLIIIIFASSLWFCFISGSTITTAYRQIHVIKETWYKKYPEEKREVPPLPKWFWKDEATANEVVNKDAEFPPIAGEFKYTYLTSTQRIPFIIFVVNIFAIAACVGIMVIGEQLRKPEEKKVGVKFEKNISGSKVSTSIGVDKLEHDLLQ
jgi:hypothetical protein